MALILDDQPRPPAEGIAGHATLDDLFRRTAARRPDALALADPPNRASFTDGEARQLTYAQADRVISALAARLHDMSLGTDALVALQIANTADSAIALLAVLRAGLIAMPLPLLWRRDAVTAAMRQTGAAAMIVSGRIGATDHFGLAVQVAADVFGVRHVCGFGRDPPDGVIPLDDLGAAERSDPRPADGRERADKHPAGAHLAVVTWDIAADGMVPVGRSHAELIAGGLAVLLESRFPEDAAILSTIPLGSFVGIAAALVPWLLVGGALVLHHPFEATAFAEQCRDLHCDAVVVPGPLVPTLTRAGLLAHDDLKSVVAVWRAPEQLPRAPEWREATPAMIDVQVFGEIGLIAGRRGPGGRPAPTPVGPVLAPRGADGALTVAEIAASPNGTVALRGPMVPRRAFPPGVERTLLPQIRADADGFVDTGFGCEVGPYATFLLVTGPPRGLVSFGGYRFAVRVIKEMVSRIDATGTLAVLPDALAGHRLAGTSKNLASLQQALREIGVTPILIDAFRDRGARTEGQQRVAG
jgi:hypothetical protein